MLSVMALVSVLNMADRQIVAILLEPIKAELGVSDTQMGMLTGLSFALFHAVASIPIALWADRSVRTKIVALGVGLWSALTLATGMVRGFGAMFALRIGVGVGEATGGPPAHSLVSDYYPPERRAGALSILVIGAPIGSMIAYASGGWINEWLGWRAVFFIFGGLGLLTAPLIYFTIREPLRGRFEAAPESLSERSEGPPLGEGLRFLFSLRSFRHLVVACALNAMGNYTFLVWAAPFLMRVHDMGTGFAGSTLALAFSLNSATGVLVGGKLVDHLSVRDVRWVLWAPAISSALAAPFGWGFLLSPTLAYAIPSLAIAGLVNTIYLGPTYAATQNLATPRTRALASAVVTVTNTILGLGIGPVLVGWLNDLGQDALGPTSIRYSLTIMLFAHIGSAYHLWRSSRSYTQDLATA